MRESPVAILYDSEGNPVGVDYNGTFYRLQTTSRLETDTGEAISDNTDGDRVYLSTMDEKQFEVLTEIRDALKVILYMQSMAFEIEGLDPDDLEVFD